MESILASERVPLASLTNITQTLMDNLKKQGRWIFILQIWRCTCTLQCCKTIVEMFCSTGTPHLVCLVSMLDITGFCCSMSLFKTANILLVNMLCYACCVPVIACCITCHFISKKTPTKQNKQQLVWVLVSWKASFGKKIHKLLPVDVLIYSLSKEGSEWGCGLICEF